MNYLYFYSSLNWIFVPLLRISYLDKIRKEYLIGQGYDFDTIDLTGVS